MVSAWASANGITLGQVVTDAKSNDTAQGAPAAFPALLDLLLLKGCIVTIDAMGCQTAIAAQITAQGGDYVLALKENHSEMYHEVVHLFADGRETDFADYTWDGVETVDGGHGRVETRRCWTISDPVTLRHVDAESAWAGLGAIAMVEAERRTGETVTQERRYYLDQSHRCTGGGTDSTRPLGH